MPPWDDWSERTGQVWWQALELARRTGTEDPSSSMSFGFMAADGTFSEETGSRTRLMTPVHLLLAAAQSSGPLRDYVRESATSPLDEAAGLTDHAGPSGVSTDIHAGQAWGSAQEWAQGLGQLLEPEHLTAVLVEQAHPDVGSTLERAGLHATQIKQLALANLGLSATVSVPLRPLPPAGMGSVPALPLDELPADVWSQLRARQQRLPLYRVKRRSQWYAVLANEDAVVRRHLGSLDLNADQIQSLLVHHRSGVEALLGEAAPAVHALLLSERDRRSRLHRRSRLRNYSRLRRMMGLLDVMAGWGVWFGNRRSNLLRRWFRLTMPGF